MECEAAVKMKRGAGLRKCSVSRIKRGAKECKRMLGRDKMK